MMHRFAKMLAANLRTIAEETARITVLTSTPNVLTHRTQQEVCAHAADRITQAEKAITSILMQPGTWKED